jgi:multisubunit Na+/H+ antiporter MnhF subunit
MFFEDTAPVILVALAIALIFLVLSLGLALGRIIYAENAFDRVVALDLVGGICLCSLVVFAIGFKQPVLLDSAFALAVMSYLGTVAFARYLERGKAK